MWDRIPDLTGICESECTGDLVLKSCGTACEKTCGKPEPMFCTMQCVSGCQCPDDLWRDGDKCVKKEDCPGNSKISNRANFEHCG